MATIQEAFDYQAKQILLNKQDIVILKTTRIYTDTDIQNYLLSNEYLTRTQLDERYQVKGNYYTREEVIVGYYNKSEIDARLTGLLNDYYTKKQVEDFVALNAGGGNVDLTDFYTKLEVDSKIEAINAPNLQDYYTKRDVDNRLTGITANYLSKIEAEAMYQLTSEIATDYVNKTTTDIQDIKGTVASPKFINNSGNLPVANSNELATTEYVDSKVGSGGATFVKTDYFTDNSELITRNDKISTETSKVAEGYKGNIEIGTGAIGQIQIATKLTGSLFIGYEATGPVYIGAEAKSFIDIGNRATSFIDIGKDATGRLEIGSSKWGTPEAPNTEGYLISGDTKVAFKKINNKANETLDSFVATGNSSAPLGTINDSTSQFFNGGTITTGNTVKLDFINSNYTFTENKKPGFALVRNDTKKLDIGKLTEKATVKVGVKIKSFTGTSVGQLDIWLNSGNLDVGADSIVLLNPNPNKFYAKSIAVLNSELVQEEGISVNITSENGNFVIDTLEVILMP